MRVRPAHAPDAPDDMISPRRALSLLLVPWLAAGCTGDDAPDEKPNPADHFYIYGPILSAATPSQRLSLEAPRMPLPDGSVPTRELNVSELFLICWPSAAWPGDVQPQVSLHPAGEPEARPIALAPRPPSGDRLTYDVPGSGAVVADAATVELPPAIATQCPDVVFGARGVMSPLPPSETPEKDADKDKDKDADKDAEKEPGKPDNEDSPDDEPEKTPDEPGKSRV